MHERKRMIDEQASTPGQGGPQPAPGQNGNPNPNLNASAGQGRNPDFDARQDAGPNSGADGRQDAGQNDESMRSANSDRGAQEDSPRLAEVEAKLAALQNEYLRAVADAENARRRAQDEVAKARKYGIEAFAESLLPFRYSLELALNVDVPSVENMREGIEVTLRQLAQAFEKNRLVQIDPTGQKFDPHLHQAISVVPGQSANPPV
ncbi:MAG: nucleotide exchange factor GrpE, partial [Gammaproteobacteria bacterium]